MRARPRLTAEQLDHRDCPALFGNPWLDPNLTLSFVPDGTPVNGTASVLDAALSNLTAATRNTEILRAFQSWVNVANVNVGVVSDGGQAAGTAGATFNDPRFGDVRVAAVPLAADDVALALPFDVSAGTRAGDLTFNSTQSFGVGTAATYDLYSIAVHEAGHIFGLAGSDDPDSVMDQVADRVRTGLGAGDVTGIQKLYGPRQADAFEGARGNGTLATAAPVQPGSGGTRTIRVQADITTADDVDVYAFKADHLDGGAYRVSLTTSGLSLLVPSVDVLDDKGNVVASQVGGAVGASDVSLRLTGLKEGDTYYARVRAADPTFAVGGYRMELRPEAQEEHGTLNDPEVGGDDSASTSQTPSRLPALDGTRQNFFVASSLSTATDVDYYRVRATGQTDAPTVLTVSVAEADANGLDPVVDVYDRNQVLQATTVLSHDGGEFSVQLPNAAVNRDYYVVVRHAAGNTSLGNYSLGLDFGGLVVPQQTFAEGTLTAAAPAVTTTLTVAEGQVLHAVLTVDPTAAAAAVRMSIFDADSHVVDTRLASGGGSASMNVFLPPGTYRLLVGGGATDGGTMPAIAYRVAGLAVSDPIGPQGVTRIDQLPPAVPPTAPSPPTTVPPIVLSPPTAVTPTSPATPTGPNILLIPPTDQGTSPTLQIRPVSPPVAKAFAVAAADPAGSVVHAFNPDGGERFSVVPFPGYTGTLRTAEADFNNDGVADLLVGTGPGTAGRVVLIDGVTEAVLFTIEPFEPTFTGGVYVAAGDVNGDGKADAVVTPDQGGGPVVAIYDGAALAAGGTAAEQRFYGIDDPTFRGGARVALGDVNGDGRTDLVVSAGYLGGPRIALYDGAALANGGQNRLAGDFFAFEDTLRNGAFVAVGDFNNDGYADLAFGGGPSGGPRVLVVSGKTLLGAGSAAALASPMANFFAGDATARGGVRVGTGDANNDGVADLITGSGQGEASLVQVYYSTRLAGGDTSTADTRYDPFHSTLADGVSVG